ncbi:alpha-amylase-related protein-like [Trichogramma pretiosum]|uniref:alpha-amylase-related protein-like n=1 Tax=Trichogramma pretiosum TaxID=7493 RepID=UPI000C71C988|nr:alpha-amylase-related protein-like [Trichogramma pretiosum]
MLKQLSLVLLCIIVSFNVLSIGATKNPHYVGHRTTMVHLFEWKWNDIANECEKFLGPKGFGGVQVSPIQENVIIPNRPWYERYQPISYKWSTRSGNEQEFRSMVRRCNKAGVRIYVDAVLNHMTGNHEKAVGTGGSTADPHKFSYPAVPFERKHFNEPCGIDYNNAKTVRDCELVGLHDLNQRLDHVRKQMIAFLNKAIDAGVAGIRIDAAKHMWPEDLKYIYSKLKNLNVEHGFPPNSRPFIFQEVIDYGGESISKFEYNEFAAVLEFKHGRELCNGIRGQNPLKYFKTWGTTWGLLPSDDAVTFVDNHDTQREGFMTPLTYREFRLYKMAVAFMLAHPYGHPRVMSSYDFKGFEQGPPADEYGNILSPISAEGTCSNGWVCEHRWRQIYNMVGFRNHVGKAPMKRWWDNGNGQVAFCRGDVGFFAINTENSDLRRKLRTCLPAGTYCDVISGELRNGRCTGHSIEVDAQGNAQIEILTSRHDGVVAYHTGAKVGKNKHHPNQL